MKVAIVVILCVGLLVEGIVADDRCPDQDDPLLPPVLLAHPTDCDKFLICSHGQAVVNKCPAGLHWNDVRKLCDYPAQAACQPGQEQSSSTTALVSEDCPEVYDPDHMVYIPHATDCGRYYICDPYRVPLEQTCPAGTHWNPLVNYCDFPELALCEK